MEASLIRQDAHLHYLITLVQPAHSTSIGERLCWCHFDSSSNNELIPRRVQAHSGRCSSGSSWDLAFSLLSPQRHGDRLGHPNF